MTAQDEKLARLVAELRKAVIGAELHRGRTDRLPPARRSLPHRPRAA
jgi:hypothetical protein